MFYIDETFNLSESGLVLCGIVGSGSFDEADQVHIGPDSSGNYRMATIKSIRRNKQPVLKVHAGETASVLIEFTTNKAGFNIKKVSLSILLIAHHHTSRKQSMNLFIQSPARIVIIEMTEMGVWLFQKKIVVISSAVSGNGRRFKPRLWSLLSEV